MLEGFVLCHPQSSDLLPRAAYAADARLRRIACGTSQVPGADLSEANDFYPTYASWNSAIFETSVILTLWEHADQLIGANAVAILHSDLSLHFDVAAIWQQVAVWLAEYPQRAIGLTAPSTFAGSWEEWLVPAAVPFIPSHDPMFLHAFEHGIQVWDYIKMLDRDLYQWALDTQPRLIYSHQFACTRLVFDWLGERLYAAAQRLRLRDLGFWTPHVFERLIALYLAQYGGEPVLSTCFWHHASSGAFGPGGLSLYGPRPRRYYQVATRWNNGQTTLAPPSHSTQSLNLGH